MDYKAKYLKYKNKYLQLKGGKYCEKCPVKGFIQHTGECWHDALSMILLFSNDISDDIQDKFNEWLEDDSKIDEYLNSIYNDKSRYVLLPFNIDVLTEELKLDIKQYITYLFARYQKELIYTKELISQKGNKIPKKLESFMRQISEISSLSCVEYLFNIIANNTSYRNTKGGTTSDSYITKSLMNYVFAKSQVIKSICIDMNIFKMYNTEESFIQYSQLIKDLINKCNGLSISITVHKISHELACIKCQDQQFIYDDNRGTDYDDGISLKKFNWKSKLLEYFSSLETFKTIDEFISFFSKYFDYIPDKKISELTFYYKDNFDSPNYFFTPSLYKKYTNEKAIKIQKQQLIDIIENKNPYIKINNDLIKNLLFYNVQLCHILFDYNVDFNINDSMILKYILIDGDNILIKRLLTHPKINMHNPELLKFGFASNKPETINMIIEHKDFDINIRNEQIGSLINYLLGKISLNEISKKLIEKGIDIFMHNSQGKTPLDYCIEYNNKEMFDILLKKYRDNNIPIEINKEVWEELAENNEDKSEQEKAEIIQYYKTILGV
jgi:hypothetical protein